MANKVKALQAWCKQQVDGYRDVSVTNMTSSWRSGLAFCALIHKYRPDLIDYDSLSKENVYENNELAFRVAKENLDIPDLLDAEDMVAMAVPDKLCIVTYVSQYYNQLRNMTPAGGPGNRGSPLKRPQTTSPEEGTQPKRITMEAKTKPVERSAPSSRPTTKQSMGDKCQICHQKVYLMERHLDSGKLYHRHCFRESQKSSFRAYRTGHYARDTDSKENVSPSQPQNATVNGTTNGTLPNSAKSMAKMWDTKIADAKGAPASLGASATPQVGTSSSTLVENKWPTSPLARAKSPTNSTPKSPQHAARPKTWDTRNNHSAQPWSPLATGAAAAAPAKSFSPITPVSPASSSASSSVSSPAVSTYIPYHSSPTFQPVSSPAELSPSAQGLFPHFESGAAASGGAAPSASSIATDIHNDLGICDRSVEVAASSIPPPARPPPPSGPSSSPPKPSPRSQKSSVSLTGEARWKTDDGVRMNLLASLSNIRQRYDKYETNATNDTNIGSGPKGVQDNPKMSDQPRSILKADEGSGHHGPRPILKHKDPVSFTDCDQPKSSDLRPPLRSILKAAGDTDSTLSGSETSPRSILKHHEEPSFDDMSRPSSHNSILKTETNDKLTATVSLSDAITGDVLRRSILRAKEASSTCDSDNSLQFEDSSRPVRSILKSRKSSGDSLLSSSGDELEDLSPRPILKMSPRSDNVVSPTSEPKSILKSKNLPHTRNDSPRESPKPILKSRESSPTRAMSPLRMSETVKPILKRNIETPTPVLSSTSSPSKSPAGPSLLKTNTSNSSDSSFATFKSDKSRSYTSLNLGFGTEDESMPRENDEKTNGIKTHEAESKPAQQSISARAIDSKSSPSRSSDKASKLSKHIERPENTKPEWMIEAKKRQAARKGRYEDPEKIPLNKSEVQEKRSTLLTDRLGNGVTDKTGVKEKKKPISNTVEPMEAVDNRPEWQKEAEKRQAMRSGGYVDPEKAPAKPKNRPPMGNTEKPDSPVKIKPSKPPPPSISPIAKAFTVDRPVSALVPPPKPMRSPLPQRIQAKERPTTEVVSAPEKPRWKVEAERRQAARQAAKQIDPAELQRNKKSPAPARPPPPHTSTGKQRIIPDTTFSCDDKAVKNGNSEYAEIGPPSQRKLRYRGNPPVDSDSKFANRPLPPVPADQDPSGPPKRKVAAETRLSSQVILRTLEDLDVELQGLEQEGRGLEEKIRSESDDAMDEADLMIAWFELVNKKNELVRKESDLMYRQRQQELEDQHEELEYELRCLIDKTDKTPSEMIREEALLQELVETVMLRNNIVDSIEEDRIRYLEEDQNIAEMMEAKGFSLKEESTSASSPVKRHGKSKKKDDKKKEKNRRRVKSCVQ